jgi:hypothetical protein
MDYNQKMKELEEKQDRDFKKAVRFYFITGIIGAVIVGMFVFVLIYTITHQ